jgi:hypothetical protein
MRFDALIKSDSIEEIPDVIKLDDNTSVKVKKTDIIITEFDKSVCPFVSAPFDKGISVGLKAEVEKRHFGENSVSVERDQIGSFMYFSFDATIKEVMNGINELIHRLCDNTDGKAE